MEADRSSMEHTSRFLALVLCALGGGRRGACKSRSSGDPDGDGTGWEDDGPLATVVVDASGTPLEGVMELAAGSGHDCASLASGEVRRRGGALGGGAPGRRLLSAAAGWTERGTG